MSESKKYVLITGCSPGGIGHAIATEFQNHGYHVIATARRAEVLGELRKTGMSVVSLDVCDRASIQKCKEEVARITAGKLDILVNNAGVNHTIPATDIEIDDVKRTFDANVFGPMLMCQAFIPLLIPARGLIVNISSVSAIMPYLFASVYCATKAALDGYSRTLRLELKPFNVRVMVAMTGTVKSNITSHFVRELPSNSLYRPVQDMYDERIHFSQNNSPMPADVYAKKLVAAALKGEGWFGGLLGRTPDWFWAGGLANVAWFGQTFFPRRFAEFLTAITFKISKMAFKIAEAKDKRS
ncbi:NAD(P)-binding domain protein [Akanthomyces lecanii RCEF 1005]|uniref:NAD(P)-binding domain protein n=1 Tax=Akanthomyces lecanii RCEF 1005 TaxID=1081108 RepID=A0A162KCL5_CORDF|nr:NAD(P)-binding domain protein [Akanthomyces lecanii RCEF 1005]